MSLLNPLSPFCRYMGHLNVRLRVALCGHILNMPWNSRIKRRQIRGIATQKAVLDYLERYVPMYSPLEVPTIHDTAKEFIFTIWLQGQEYAPDIVKACWRSIRDHSDLELIVLDEKTIFDWIELPDFIVDKWRDGKIRPAHFADICRIELLYRYGGLWMDATDFLFDDFPQWLLAQDFFVYSSGTTLKGFYSSIQNCFIRARKSSYLLKAWRNAVHIYWEHEDSAVDYFVHQLLFRKVLDTDPIAAEHFEAMPHIIQDSTHVLWYEFSDRPFDRNLFEELASSAVFHKCEYKSLSARAPQPGSFADIMINGRL